MGSAENGGGQHPAPEGRQIGTPPPEMFMTPSLSFTLNLKVNHWLHLYKTILIHCREDLKNEKSPKGGGVG